MSSVPRIVTVDAAYDVARIVRGALTLLSRPHILIEVPTAEDALEEIRTSTIALVVTAYRIPGDTNGVELATRISRESLGSPVIVLGEEGDPLDNPALRDAPFQVFTRPVAEPFLRGLRLALDGPSAVVEEKPREVAPGLDLGPVPPVNIHELQQVVDSVIRDVGAMAVIVADRTGRILIEKGATGYIDRQTLALILGPAFARSAEISPLIGSDPWTMHYYDGERLDVFGLSLGLHYFMCLIFEGSNRAAFGAVMMFGRRAADQMIAMIGEAAYATRKPEPPVPVVKEKEPPKKEPTPAPAPDKEAAPVPLESLFDQAAVGSTALLDFDPDALFNQSVDESLAESLFNDEVVSNLAETLVADEEERYGYDAAVDMGILEE